MFFFSCSLLSSEGRVVLVFLVLVLVFFGVLCGILGFVICYFICIVKVINIYS